MDANLAADVSWAFVASEFLHKNQIKVNELIQ